MADNKKISDLPDDTSVTLADYVPIVTPGSPQTKKATLAHIMALAGGGSGGGSGAPAVFLDNFMVNIPNNPTGIPNGTQVNAGDPIAAFIEAAFKKASPPTVSLDTNGNLQQYNQTHIDLIISMAYTINTSGATLQNIKLECHRDNGTWTTLVDTSTPTTSYTDSINPGVNNSSVYYKVTVTDSSGGTNTATKQVDFSAYVAPTISFSLSSTTKEHGDVDNLISGKITRISQNVALTSYQLQYQVNDPGPWIDIGSPVLISGSSQDISIPHNNPLLKTSNFINYRVQVTDAQQTTTSGTQTINFYYRLWYDAVANVPLTSADVRALTFTQLSNTGNTFTLNTGTINRNFVIVLPPGKSLLSVVNIEASNANITSEFVATPISVNDIGNTASTYTLFTKTTSIPYSPANHLAITLA